MTARLFLIAASGMALMVAVPERAHCQASADQAASSAAPDDLSQFQSANDLWAHIQDLAQGPSTSQPGPEQVATLVHQIDGAVAKFQGQYPHDPRRWEGKLIALRFDSILANAESQPLDPGTVESELKTIAAAPDASKDVRVVARMNLIEIHASGSPEGGLSPELEKEMLAFIHDFPDDPNVAQLQSMRLESLEKSDPFKAALLLTKLLKDPNPVVKKMAEAEVRMSELSKKPLEMKFTAADGSPVDVSKLRGKVVLIDFWATWCPPCMAEVPEVVEINNALHDKGLDIVGISLDQDKGRMEAVTKTKGMTWPQYFDGKGWENEISSSYGISSIPRMWLVNKKGMVVDSDAGDGLKEKIEKLLAE